jgi:uncharacterized protein YfdQ (DUF2303 family)
MDLTNYNKKNGAQAIIDVVQRLAQTEVLGVKDPNDAAAPTVDYIVLPAGKTVASLKPIIDAFRTAPERRRGTATLTTEAAFIEHLNRFKGDDTVVFADRSAPAPHMLAVYDYNPAGGSVTAAAFGTHRAKYPFPLSDEWKAWLAQNEKTMEPLAFAQFLEDRLADVIGVDVDDDEAEDLKNFAVLVGGMYAAPAKLLELSRSLDINAAVAVRQAFTLASGEINIAYAEVHNDGEGRPIKVPNLFAIGIPVFVDGPKYRIVCRLRYRVGGGKVTWSYSMVHPARYFDDAVKAAVDKVVAEADVPVFFGAPES